MSHELRMWIVPLLALVAGLLGYFRTPAAAGKTAEAWRCLYWCGLFICVWLLTFGAWPK